MDLVLIILGTQVIKKKRPVWPVFQTIFPFLMTMVHCTNIKMAQSQPAISLIQIST